MRKNFVLGVSGLAIAMMGSAAFAADQNDGEIIITATKRATTLQDVPISVSVTSGDTIKQAVITDVIDLQSVVPSLSVYQLQNTGQTGFAIRGFGNGTGNPGIEASVGIFVDGVYRSRSSSSLADLPDLERVEVLRGPQSTLFGKNVSVGAVSIITKAPSFKPGGAVEVEIGNYGEFLARGNINAPLSDTLAVRLYASENRRDGYTTNTVVPGTVNDRDRYSLRADVLYKPSSSFSLRVIADYNDIAENCCTVQSLYNGSATQLVGAPVSVGGLGKPVSNPTNVYGYQTPYNKLPQNYLQGKGVSGQIDWDIGFAKLTSITAYRDQKYTVAQDVDFTGAELVNQNSADRYKTFTQEFRLASKGSGPLSWLLGAFYGHEDIATDNKLTFGADAYNYLNGLAGGGVGLLEGLEHNVIPSIIPGKYYFQPGQGIDDNWDMIDKSFSIFGQADYKILPKLTLTGGVAYLHDNKSLSSNVILNDPYSSTDFNNIPALGFIPTAALGANPSTAALAQALGALGYANLPTNLFSGAVTNQNPQLAALAAGAVPGETPAMQAQYAAILSQSLAGVNQLGALKQLQFFYPDTHAPVQCNSSGDCVRSDSKVTYTGRIAYEITKHFNIYASYGTGWKAAAANLSNASRPQNAQGYGRFAFPESTSVWEVGLKSSFRSGYANIAVFKETITNLQNNAFVGTSFQLANAGQESVKGFEWDVSYRPIKPLVLTWSGTYLDEKYDSFVGAPCATLPTTNPCTGTQQSHDVSGSSPGDYSHWASTVSATITQPLGGGFTGRLRGEYDYRSSYLASNTVPAQYSTVSVNSINASIGLEMPYRFDVSFWVRNLTNDHYLYSAFQTTIQSGSYSGYPNEPRRYGVSLRKSF